MVFRALFLSVLLPLCAPAADKVVVNGKLQWDALNKAYLESEWESLSRQLEAFLKSGKTDSLPVHDRIAAYKYLGTIYAADSLTRTRAEANFFLLLDLSPDIEIADLYVSNPINEFFQGIKRKHRAQKEYEAKYDAYGFPRTATAGPGAKTDANPSSARPADSGKPAKAVAAGKAAPGPARIREKDGHAWIWWTTGTLAAAAVGVYLYFAFSEPPPNRIPAVIRGWEPLVP